MRHTMGRGDMDKYAVARLMGNSSPRVAVHYYIHATQPHVTTGFGRFVTYLQARLIDSISATTNTVQ